jgi:DNA helicase TIP49 (TBP-interacting protein)
MKKNTVGMIVAMAMAFCSTSLVLAGEDAPTAQRDLPSMTMGANTKVTATVEAINHATREVALRSPDGSLEIIVAGEEVRNLAQVEVGDVVKIEYSVGLMLALQPVSGGIRERREKVEEERAELGQKPAGAVRKTVYARAVVRAVDLQARTVTLQGALKTVTLPVAEDVDLNSVKVGDMVDAKYVESLAISVQPAPAKP